MICPYKGKVQRSYYNNLISFDNAFLYEEWDFTYYRLSFVCKMRLFLLFARKFHYVTTIQWKTSVLFQEFIMWPLPLGEKYHFFSLYYELISARHIYYQFKIIFEIHLREQKVTLIWRHFIEFPKIASILSFLSRACTMYMCVLISFIASCGIVQLLLTCETRNSGKPVVLSADSLFSILEWTRGQ